MRPWLSRSHSRAPRRADRHLVLGLRCLQPGGSSTSAWAADTPSPPTSGEGTQPARRTVRDLVHGLVAGPAASSTWSARSWPVRPRSRRRRLCVWRRLPGPLLSALLVIPMTLQWSHRSGGRSQAHQPVDHSLLLEQGHCLHAIGQRSATPHPTRSPASACVGNCAETSPLGYSQW